MHSALIVEGDMPREREREREREALLDTYGIPRTEVHLPRTFNVNSLHASSLNHSLFPNGIPRRWTNYTRTFHVNSRSSL